MTNQIEYIHIDKIHLDFQNPRLSEGFRKKNKSEDDIINWMLEDGSLLELMLAIGQNDFFVGEALLVIPSEEGYTVIEGNRRASAVKLLKKPDIAKIHINKINKILAETSKRPSQIPCVIFNDRSAIVQYLGYRHVTGIKAWSLIAKSRYLSELAKSKDFNGKSINYIARELAKSIGSKQDYVKRLLVGYQLYEKIKDNGFYKIEKLDEDSFYFNYLADSLRQKNIAGFISINMDEDDPINRFDDSGERNLKKLIKWFFEKNSEQHSRVLGDSDGLTALNSILGNDLALSKFESGESLSDALRYTKHGADDFTNSIRQSLNTLKYAQSVIHQIKNHNSNDIDNLKELADLAKNMRRSIESKQEDDDES